MNSRKYISFLVLLGTILLGVSCAQKKAEWKGKIRQENGVTIISNPREPMYPGRVLTLEKELVIGGEEAADGRAFSSIGSSSSVEVDDEGNIFVLSPRDAAVFVYDGQGNFLRKFGRPGQGPGELGPAQSIFISGETVWINCLDRKISVFNRNGDFLRSFSTKEFTIYFAKCDRWGNIYGFEPGWLKDNPAVRLLKFDGEMNFLMEITRYPIPEPDKPLDPFAPLPYWQMTSDERLVFSRPEAYLLEFYNSDGRLVRQVSKSFSPVRITDEEKERHKRSFSGEVKFRLEYHPGFGRFICDDQGRLFVQTFEQSSDGSYIHDIFDDQGRFMARIPLKGSLLAGKRDKLYCSDEDEKGFSILVRYGLRWNLK
ncbi:MAG: 6-bladed beta-propeller [Candidatus Saccharicenans sp.]|nr:6-bladed beta-propeller [Candidatus Saccharicenans sp.]